MPSKTKTPKNIKAEKTKVAKIDGKVIKKEDMVANANVFKKAITGVIKKGE